MRIRTIVYLVLLFSGAEALADDPCGDVIAEAPKYFRDDAQEGEFVETTETGALRSVRTVARFHHASGDGILLKWSFGAAGRVECAFIGYRSADATYTHFRVAANHVLVSDRDNDGDDEIETIVRPGWAMECSASMAELASETRVSILDVLQGQLVDRTSDHEVRMREHLKRQVENYDRAKVFSANTGTPECTAHWTDLLQKLYDAAFRTMLLTAGALSIVISCFGFARSKRIRWLSKLAGALLFLATTTVLFLSVGSAGWYFLGFTDAWSSFQIMSGLRFDSLPLEILSVLCSLYASWKLLNQ